MSYMYPPLRVRNGKLEIATRYTVQRCDDHTVIVSHAAERDIITAVTGPVAEFSGPASTERNNHLRAYISGPDLPRGWRRWMRWLSDNFALRSARRATGTGYLDVMQTRNRDWTAHSFWYGRHYDLCDRTTREPVRYTTEKAARQAAEKAAKMPRTEYDNAAFIWVLDEYSPAGLVARMSAHCTAEAATDGEGMVNTFTINGAITPAQAARAHEDATRMAIALNGGDAIADCALGLAAQFANVQTGKPIDRAQAMVCAERLVNLYLRAQRHGLAFWSIAQTEGRAALRQRAPGLSYAEEGAAIEMVLKLLVRALDEVRSDRAA